MSELTKKLIQIGELVIGGWKEFEKGKVTADQILRLIAILVDAAEDIITQAKAGQIKHRAVMEAFQHFDREYGLIAYLDQQIKLPFLLDLFDARFFRLSIEMLIKMAVEAMNRQKEKFVEVAANSTRPGELSGAQAGGDKVTGRDACPTGRAETRSPRQ